MGMLVVALLGAPRVERDGRPVVVDTRKAVALLAYLAVTGQAHRRDALAALLWPDADTARARGALRRTLSALAKGLGGGWLVAGREAIGLDREGLELDIERFRRLADEAGDDPTLLERAVALHRGEFLAGFGVRGCEGFDDWQFFEGESLKREHAAALERLVDALAARGAFDRAITHARRWLALDPLHEPAHRGLIRLYAWSGDRVAAIRQYRECVRVLTQELGVGPLEETTALYESVNAGTLCSPQPSLPTPSLSPDPIPSRGTAPLVGRDAELRLVVARHSAVVADGQLVVLEGEAGIGKTRLAEELLAHARAEGAATFAARCHEGEEQLAYGLVTEALRAAITTEPTGWVQKVPPDAVAEAARLVPDLAQLHGGVPAALPHDSPGAQARMLEGVATTLAVACSGAPAGVLLLDDLHWADSASLDVLTYLVRRLENRPAYIVVTWRTEEIPPQHRLRLLLAEAARAGSATQVELARLGPVDVARLVAAAGLPSGIVSRLHSETGGLPFSVVEHLDEMASGRLATDAAEWPVPGGVRDLLRARLGRLSETGRQVCTTAAVIGGSFDADVLRVASGRSDDETVSALEELISRGFVNERERGAYDFAHPRTRALVYAETSLARRRLLHRRVAEALRGGRSKAALVANHLRLAGDDGVAAELFAVAAEHARELHANAEAVAHFEAALALGHPQAARLHEAVGDLQTLAGEYGAALKRYETAAALGADVEQKLGQIHHRRGHWALAERHFAAAFTATDQPGTRSRLEADRSLNAHRAGDAAEAQAHAARALRLAEEAGDGLALAQARNISGVLASSRGEHDVARHHLEESLGHANDLPARVAALNNLALACAAAGERGRALELASTALQLCTAFGDRHRQAALHSNLADLLHAAGRDSEAIAQLTEAARLFAEIDEPGLREPEIWKLVEW
ncbi:MAG: ATP-binding protein [Egibacteraceae bacterium]